MAVELDMPIVIHCRDAEEDCVEVLEKVNTDTPLIISDYHNKIKKKRSESDEEEEYFQGLQFNFILHKSPVVLVLAYKLIIFFKMRSSIKLIMI